MPGRLAPHPQASGEVPRRPARRAALVPRRAARVDRRLPPSLPRLGGISPHISPYLPPSLPRLGGGGCVEPPPRQPLRTPRSRALGSARQASVRHSSPYLPISPHISPYLPRQASVTDAALDSLEARCSSALSPRPGHVHDTSMTRPSHAPSGATPPPSRRRREEALRGRLPPALAPARGPLRRRHPRAAARARRPRRARTHAARAGSLRAGTSRPHLGSIPAPSRLHLGHISATSRLHLSHTHIPLRAGAPLSLRRRLRRGPPAPVGDAAAARPAEAKGAGGGRRSGRAALLAEGWRGGPGGGRRRSARAALPGAAGRARGGRRELQGELLCTPRP